MKRVHIATPTRCYITNLACSRYAKYFRKSGWKTTRRISHADIIIINTCGFSNKREDDSIKLLEDFKKKKKKNAKIILAGCLHDINPLRLKQVFDGVVIRFCNFNMIKDMINSDIEPELVMANKIGVNYYVHEPLIEKLILLKRFLTHLKRTIPFYFTKNTYYINIAEGCLGNCSYCAIKFARGRFKSKPVDDVIKEFKEGLNSKHKKFLLLADDCGCYGIDIGTNLIALLKKMVEAEGKYKISLYNLNPNWLIEYYSGLKELFATGRFYVINIPFQSASNRILKLMNRGYRIEDFERIIKDMKETFPKIAILTHVLVGFPGETEADFLSSLNFVKRVNFDIVGAFKYDDRPNIKAATFEDKIPETIKQERLKRVYSSGINFY